MVHGQPFIGHPAEDTRLTMALGLSPFDRKPMRLGKHPFNAVRPREQAAHPFAFHHMRTGLDQLERRGVHHLTIPPDYGRIERGSRHGHLIPTRSPLDRNFRHRAAFNEGHGGIGLHIIPDFTIPSTPLDDHRVHHLSVRQSEVPGARLLGHEVGSVADELGLHHSTGVHLDHGANGPSIGFGAAKPNGQPARASAFVRRRIPQDLDEGHVAEANHIRGQILVDVAGAHAVELRLLIGPGRLRHIHEPVFRVSVFIEIVVIGEGIRKPVCGHHQVTPHVPVGIHEASTPAVAGTIDPHLRAHLLIDRTNPIEHEVGLVLDVRAEQLHDPIVVQIAHRSRHAENGLSGPHILRHIHKGAVALVLIQRIGIDVPVVDHPKVLVSVLIVVEPNGLEGVLHLVAHSGQLRHIREESGAIVVEQKILVCRPGPIMVEADVDIQVAIEIVITDAQASTFPIRVDGQSSIRSFLDEHIPCPHVQFHAGKAPRDHQIEVLVPIRIEPRQPLRLGLTLESVHQIESTFGELGIGHHGSIAVGEGQVVESIQVEVGEAHAATQPTGLRGRLEQIDLRHILPLGLSAKSGRHGHNQEQRGGEAHGSNQRMKVENRRRENVPPYVGSTSAVRSRSVSAVQMGSSSS